MGRLKSGIAPRYPGTQKEARRGYQLNMAPRKTITMDTRPRKVQAFSCLNRHAGEPINPPTYKPPHIKGKPSSQLKCSPAANPKIIKISIMTIFTYLSLSFSVGDQLSQ